MFDKHQENKFDGIAEFERPEGLKEGITLYPYQQDGVRWLLHQETDEERIPPFWKERSLGTINKKQWWWNQLTNRYQNEKPKPCKGAILADDMGLVRAFCVYDFV